MQPLAVTFPSTEARVGNLLEAALTTTYSNGLTVARKLPDAFTRRMVSYRNDSGPDEGIQSRRRYGVNVYADSFADAENMCLVAMRYLRTAADGMPITRFDSFTGPFEIEDEPVLKVGTLELTHMYFAFRLSVRGS